MPRNSVTMKVSSLFPSSPLLVLLVLQLLAGRGSCSLFGEDARWQQCRMSIAKSPPLPGPPTASANPTTGMPQQCGFLFPGRNNYNKQNEDVIGSFVAPDCGACAAACVASYLSCTAQPTVGPYRYMDEVAARMAPDALRDYGDLLVTSVRECRPCTDWNYCSPEVAVVTQSASLRQGVNADGAAMFVPEDPYFAGRACVGRFADSGEAEPYGYTGYGPDLCLVKSTTGCNNPDASKQVPAGTCTLKHNPSTEMAAHFPPELDVDDPSVSNAYIGNTNEDIWDWHQGDRWSRWNSMWDGELDGCPGGDVPYPIFNASDMAVCPGIDPEAGAFMSGMCDWTPASKCD